MDNICLQKVVKWKYTVAENGNTEVQVPQIVAKYSIWINVLGYIPSLL